MTSKIPNEQYADGVQNVPPSDIPAQHSSQDTDNNIKENEGAEMSRSSIYCL